MAKLNKLAAIVVAALILALGFTTQVSAADAVKYLVVKKLNKKDCFDTKGQSCIFPHEDTELSLFAKTYGLSVDEICKLNREVGEECKPGLILKEKTVLLFDI
ncbi:MAG: LysM peptidoglycan-binding domain-containing protein [Candidatus Nomurabacteria bacterium]|nr:MAG: LysM peptidoglycan-binding domain-containing protein [Candidatus Nomurabacteria bacterium]